MYEVIAGELEMQVDGLTLVVRPGIVAIVPSNARHSVKALTDGRVIIVDHPARPELGYIRPFDPVDRGIPERKSLGVGRWRLVQFDRDGILLSTSRGAEWWSRGRFSGQQRYTPYTSELLGYRSLAGADALEQRREPGHSMERHQVGTAFKGWGAHIPPVGCSLEPRQGFARQAGPRTDLAPIKQIFPVANARRVIGFGNRQHVG